MGEKNTISLVTQLESDPLLILCPVCRQTARTKVHRDSSRPMRTFIVLLSIVSCFWCLMCMWSPAKTTAHSCGVCGVRLSKFFIPQHTYDPKKTLASYVKRLLTAQPNRVVESDDESEDQPPPYQAEETQPAFVERSMNVSGIQSPLRLLPPIQSPENATLQHLTHVFEIDAPRNLEGDWKITSKDTNYNYVLRVGDIPAWIEPSGNRYDASEQFLPEHNLRPIGNNRTYIHRRDNEFNESAEITLIIDTRTGSWATEVATPSHSFVFAVPDKLEVSASNWELTSREGPLFWALDSRERPVFRGYSKLEIVDAYERSCAEVKMGRPYRIRISPRLDVLVVDEMVGIAVALLIQQQRYFAWYVLNHSD